jgi:hypothetical protein
VIPVRHLQHSGRFRGNNSQESNDLLSGLDAQAVAKAGADPLDKGSDLFEI